MPSKLYVFIDVTFGAKLGGRIVFELFKDAAPKTVENFRALCTGEYGNSSRTGSPLSYRGSKFFNVVPGLLAQGGDIEFNDGRGGESIYGATFKDESFIRRHCHAGILSMSNFGRHTNNSQFLITLKKAPQLDGRNVAFGRVIQGMDVVRAIEKCPLDSTGTPRVPIVIVDCGQIRNAPNRSTKKPLMEMKDNIALLMSTLESDPAPPPSADEPETSLTELAQHSHQADSAKDQIRDAFLHRLQLAGTSSDSASSDSEASEADAPAEDEKEEELEIPASLPDEKVKKLRELRQRIQESEKLNFSEVTASELSWKRSHKAEEDPDDPALPESVPQKKKTSSSHRAWSLHEPASVVQYRDDMANKKKKNIENSFGWNAVNIGASYRAHKKRTANLKLRTDEYAQQMLQLGEHFYDPTAVLVSAEFTPTQEAKERLASFVEQGIAKKKTFRRRRMYIENETVEHINEFNRSFNKKLSNAYGAHSLEIRRNLERGTAL